MGRAAGNTHFYVLGKDLFTADSVAERPPHEEHFEFLRHDGCGARNNLGPELRGTVGALRRARVRNREKGIDSWPCESNLSPDDAVRHSTYRSIALARAECVKVGTNLTPMQVTMT